MTQEELKMVKEEIKDVREEVRKDEEASRASRRLVSFFISLVVCVAICGVVGYQVLADRGENPMAGLAIGALIGAFIGAKIGLWV